MSYMTLFIVVFLLLFHSSVSTYSECKSDELSEDCFSIVTHKLDFLNATNYCQRFNGSLVTIIKPEQEIAVYQALKSKQITTAWIGLHDMTPTKTYKWVSNYPSLPQTYWTSNEPIDFDMMDATCVSLNSSEILLATWIKEKCSAQLPFVCGKIPPMSDALNVIAQGTCPEGFRRVMNRCFQIFGDLKMNQLTWREAQEKCQSLHNGGNLGTILSFAEQSFFTAYMSEAQVNLWIGLSYYNQTRAWVNGHDITFTNWKFGEPSFGKNENCTVMYDRIKNVGQWNDESCNKKNGYLCEAPLQIMDSNLTNSSNPVMFDLFKQGGCSKNFFEFNKACYTILHRPQDQTKMLSTGFTLEEAWSECAALLPGNSSHLVIPHNQIEAAFVRALITQHHELMTATSGNASLAGTVVWIGIKVAATPEDGFQWNISDSVEAGLGDLILEISSNPFVNACYALSDQWESIVVKHCMEPIRSTPVCAYELETHPHHPKFMNKTCPPNKREIEWHAYGDSCYYISKYKLSANDAERQCDKENAHLAAIHSDLEMSFVRNLMIESSSEPLWIGLKVKKGLELENIIVAQFVWADGSEYDYAHFRSGEPSFKNANYELEECVQVREKSHEWNDAVCGTESHFICETSAIDDSNDVTTASLAVSTESSSTAATVTVTNKPTSAKPTCSEGFEFHNSCYKYIQQNLLLSWLDAASYCDHYGWKLPTFHSHDEELRFSDLMRTMLPSKTDEIWLGMNQQEFSFAPWAWQDQSAVNYSHIHPEPLNSAGQNHSWCLSLHLGKALKSKNFQWQKSHCDKKLAFVCHSGPTYPSVSQPQFHGLDEDPTLTCMNGFQRYRNKCYQLINEPTSWKQAKSKCSQLHTESHLATVDSFQDNLFLSSLGTDTLAYAMWFGLEVDVTSEVLGWVTGDSLNYTMPVADDPFTRHLYNLDDNVNESEAYCISMLNNNNPFQQGQWIYHNCLKKLPFLCEIKPNAQQSAAAALQTEELCPGDFTRFHQKCYFQPTLAALLTNKEAGDACSKHNAQLLTMNSTHEEHFILSWLFSKQSLHSGDQIWLGMQIPSTSPQTEEWKWNDNTEVRFTHFSMMKQYPITKLRNCVTLLYNGYTETALPGFIFEPDQDCDLTKAYGVCEKYLQSQESPTTVDKIGCEEMNSRLAAISMDEVPAVAYQLDDMPSKSNTGQECWRWDIISKDNFTYSFSPISVLLGGRGYLSYLGNRCAYFHDNSSFGCFVSPSQWQACANCTVQKRSATLHKDVLIILFFMCILFLLGFTVYCYRSRKYCFKNKCQRHALLTNADEESSTWSTSFHNPIYKKLSESA